MGYKHVEIELLSLLVFDYRGFAFWLESTVYSKKETWIAGSEMISKHLSATTHRIRYNRI